jgi:hypothetical protein
MSFQAVYTNAAIEAYGSLFYFSLLVAKAALKSEFLEDK